MNRQAKDYNVGYDVNPQFSPDGKYVAWQSMKRDGCESDRNRLCIYTLATGEKRYVTESFDSNVDDYCWAANSQTLYFIGVWHGCVNMYQTNLAGRVMQLTEGWHDYASVQLLGNTGKLLAMRHSYSHPDELFVVTPSKKEKKADVKQITDENKHIFDQLEMGKVQQRWVNTVDGKKELVWIILPPHFDPNKKYPALLFCEGGPQSPVSQFWSYRWNFQIMAANGYVIIAPNRRGLPTSVSRLSSLTMVPSTSKPCTPKQKRIGSQIGNTMMRTGTKTKRPTPNAHTKTRPIALSTNGIRPYSAFMARKIIASTPPKA